MGCKPTSGCITMKQKESTEDEPILALCGHFEVHVPKLDVTAFASVPARMKNDVSREPCFKNQVDSLSMATHHLFSKDSMFLGAAPGNRLTTLHTTEKVSFVEYPAFDRRSVEVPSSPLSDLGSSCLAG